jgi:hypothetical protein
MSKQIGLIKVKGNLDGVSFYQSDGENFVRMAKGPDKKRILTDPAFKRTRENNQEFGGSAQAAKSFRSSLLPVIKAADKRFTGRTLKQFKMINVKGAGSRGMRTIDTSKYRSLIGNLELDEKMSLGSLFEVEVVTSHTPERTAGSVQIPEFSALASIVQTEGATHFRIAHVLSVISDFAFNDLTKKYEPVEPGLDRKNKVVYSDYIPLTSNKVAAMNLNVALNGIVPTVKTSVVQTLGIFFYEESVEDGFVLLSQVNAAKVVDIF